MKFAVIAVFMVALVSANAATVDPLVQSIATMGGLKESIVEEAHKVASEMEHAYEELMVEPVLRIEEFVSEIEKRKEESEVCVEQQEANIDTALQNLDDSLDVCLQTASETSLTISIEIAKVSTEIAADTISLAQGIQKCRRKKPAFQTICYTKQIIKAKKLISKTRKAKNDMIKLSEETIPGVVTDFESCSTSAEKSAQSQLEEINRNIDRCINEQA